MLAAALGVLIIAGYVLALWWLLRAEQPRTWVALLGLCAVALALHLVLSSEYPPGLNEDEPKVLKCATSALQRGDLFRESCIHIPYLLTALFVAPLEPYLGATRWTMRSYSLVTGVLAVPAAFAAARALGLSVAASLAAGGLVAVLPWSLLYGRIMFGGELIFHQLLLLAALARLVWKRGGRADALLGGFALCLLLWDYYAGRAMVAMPLVAAALAVGWQQRARCMAVIPIALLGWYPHLRTGPVLGGVGFSLHPNGAAQYQAVALHPDFAAAPWDALVHRTTLALQTFVWPVAQVSINTVCAAAVHPAFVLLLAGIGLFTGLRRGLFLLAGFCAGILPGVVSNSAGISTHRILMAYVFIALAAGAALDFLPRPRLRLAATLALLLVAGVWSARYFFSPRFWVGNSRLAFDAERTALNEIVARDAPRRLITMSQMTYFNYYGSNVDALGWDQLSADNWLPPNGEAVTYLFTREAGLLRPQYERVFPGRVQPVDVAFLVRLEANDWSWLRRYGWTYQVTCGTQRRQVQVPFLFSLSLAVRAVQCRKDPTHVWRAHWHGPETDMVLLFNGKAQVEAPGVSVTRDGWEARLPFRLPADADVAITLQTPVAFPWPRAMLLEKWAAGQRAPDWEQFTPIGVDAAVPLRSAAANP